VLDFVTPLVGLVGLVGLEEEIFTPWALKEQKGKGRV
jgi:hypothetical protein